MLPNDILDSYKDRIQMTIEEFKKYIAGRESKPLLVLELESINKLKEPVAVIRPVTMAGRYVSYDEISYFLKNYV